MEHNPYERFRGQKLSLNDYLAIDRTELANERTLLAYGRTSIALVITGGSAMKFFESRWVVLAGAGFVVVAVVVMIVGWRRYRAMDRRLGGALEQRAGDVNQQ
ncbi:MAG: DUF202 domain-containing protein [Candidatus Hydrogenedentes bacterium]|nr:DUF202 domain-containing protein [Candidatus Hydrogenedentota bacterium]